MAGHHLKVFVAEVTCLGGGIPHWETWTIRAKDKADAVRKMTKAAGRAPNLVAEAPAEPTRHWNAGR